MALKFKTYEALPEVSVRITRENVNELLDAGMLYAHMLGGRWWVARRNGKTQTWKKDALRIRIPVKMGLKVCSAIETGDFIDGVLRSDYWRHKNDTPNAK